MLAVLGMRTVWKSVQLIEDICYIAHRLALCISVLMVINMYTVYTVYTELLYLYCFSFTDSCFKDDRL